MKKLVLCLIILSLFAVFSFFHAETENRADKFRVIWEFNDEPAFIIGVLPYRSDDEIKQDLGPLVNYLQHHLKTAVKLVVSPDYPTLGRLLELKKIQLAWFSHALLEQTPGREKLTIICRPQSAGKTEHKGGILVPNDSLLQGLSDLEGKRFAYVSQYSGSGFVFPARMFRNLGIDPVASFSEIIFTGNHSRSIEALRSGEVDAAAIFCDSTTNGVILPEGMRALAFTESIPSDPLVVRNDLEPELKIRLKELLTNMSDFAKGGETLQHLNLRRGFEAFVAEN